MTRTAGANVHNVVAESGLQRGDLSARHVDMADQMALLPDLARHIALW
jgi:hypothetical protein